jgi:glycogen(starch) synthase
MLAQLHARAPEIRSRSSVILNGLDFPAALPEPIPADGHRLLCLGRLHFQKGFDLALSALAAIVDRFPNARLTIAGDGPERAALERRAYELNLTGVVDFIGWVSPDKVSELLNAATLILMPSRSEPFGLVALEAASMARPVIASRVGGLPEVVVDGTTGLLVDAENSQELAQAIAVMLTHPQQAAQMGQAGRKRARECFAWQHCVDSYDELYQKLAGGGAGERTHSKPAPNS